MNWGALPNQLSGGQMQRVAICASAGAKPAILLPDEPPEFGHITGNLIWNCCSG